MPGPKVKLEELVGHLNNAHLPEGYYVFEKKITLDAAQFYLSIYGLLTKGGYLKKVVKNYVRERKREHRAYSYRAIYHEVMDLSGMCFTIVKRMSRANRKKCSFVDTGKSVKNP